MYIFSGLWADCARSEAEVLSNYIWLDASYWIILFQFLLRVYWFLFYSFLILVVFKYTITVFGTFFLLNKILLLIKNKFFTYPNPTLDSQPHYLFVSCCASYPKITLPTSRQIDNQEEQHFCKRVITSMLSIGTQSYQLRKILFTYTWEMLKHTCKFSKSRTHNNNGHFKNFPRPLLYQWSF